MIPRSFEFDDKVNKTRIEPRTGIAVALVRVYRAVGLTGIGEFIVRSHVYRTRRVDDSYIVEVNRCGCVESGSE